MLNKELYKQLVNLIRSGELVYACKDIPEMFVKGTLWGHAMAVNADKASFLVEIKNKAKDGQLFNQRELEYALHKSASYIKGEVFRGAYMLVMAGKYKLYIVKDW